MHLHLLCAAAPNVAQSNSAERLFLLNGFGEPATPVGQVKNSTDARRSWRCWCALHRSSMSNDLKTEVIILELDPAAEESGFSTLFYGKKRQDAGHRRSQSSVPVSPGGTDLSGESYFSGMYFDGGSQTHTGSTSSSMSPSISGDDYVEQSLPYSRIDNLRPLRPMVDAILDSTTNRAQPIASLERLRSRVTLQRSTSYIAQSTTRRRPNGRRINSDTRVPTMGSMEVLTVLSDINRQLDAAQDLETLGNVVTGIVQDMTQAHRVFISRFDSEGNFEVVAEMIDRSRVQNESDLYKGLHFAADAIASEVC
jgi:hypothetical protein